MVVWIAHAEEDPAHGGAVHPVMTDPLLGLGVVELVEALGAAKQTVAAAESLTAGLFTAAVASVPGSSAGERPSREVSVWASRSTGCTPARAPSAFPLPVGVRTESTTTTSRGSVEERV